MPPTARPRLCLAPPVDGPVVEPFRAPPCPYCAGHRGLTYAARPGSAVRAAAAGTVSFSGSVAGVRYVVIAHAGGWRTTYGGLVAAAVGPGSPVAPGDVVALAGSRVYLGLRRGDRYVDPTPYLGALRRRARLVPLDGSAPRPARSWSTPVCATTGPSGDDWRGTALLRGVAAQAPR
ncbi:MAG: murein hydrolase activator EnvC family protein [Ilumatobacteraceae bacterium]